MILKTIDAFGLAIIVPCTTTPPGTRAFVYVKLGAGSGGLTKESYALCHQIRTVSYRRLDKTKIGTLTTREMGKIKQVLADLLDL